MIKWFKNLFKKEEEEISIKKEEEIPKTYKVDEEGHITVKFGKFTMTLGIGEMFDKLQPGTEVTLTDEAIAELQRACKLTEKEIKRGEKVSMGSTGFLGEYPYER